MSLLSDTVTPSSSTTLIATLTSSAPFYFSSTTTPSTSHHTNYLTRLTTYTPLTFFGKPPSISPPICALHGYTNTSLDVITCGECNNQLTLTIDPTHTLSSADTVAEEYAKALITTHASSCVWSVGPTASSFLEYPKERALVANWRAECETIKNKIEATTPCTMEEVRVHVDGIKDHMYKPCETMALLNWTVESATRDELSVKCDVCAATGVVCVTMAAAGGGKRRKVGGFDTVESHRYFCACLEEGGWRVLAGRIEEEGKEGGREKLSVVERAERVLESLNSREP